MYNFDKSEMDGPCSSIRCQYGRLKPKATWINTFEGKWYCFQCAQDFNRGAMQLSMKYGGVVGKKVCIPGEEYVLQLLSKPN